jgi:hypothetical protein
VGQVIGFGHLPCFVKRTNLQEHSMRRYILAGLCLALAAATQLSAQGNKAELYGGFVYTKADPIAPLPKANMNGWVGSVTGYANSWFGVGGEISAVFGDIAHEINAPGPHAKEYSYLFGPQFRFLDGKKVQSSVKVLLGGSFAQVNLASGTSAAQQQALAAAGYSGFNQTKFAALFAVPVDVAVSKLIAIRVEPGLYMTDFNHTKQGNFRFSVGPVFRFGGR